MIHHRIPYVNIYLKHLKRYTTYMEKLSGRGTANKNVHLTCFTAMSQPDNYIVQYDCNTGNIYLCFLLLWPLSPVQLPFLITMCSFFHWCNASDSTFCCFLHSRYFWQWEWQPECRSVQSLQGNVTIVIFPLSICSYRQLCRTSQYQHYLLHRHCTDIFGRYGQMFLLFFWKIQEPIFCLQNLDQYTI